MSSFCLNTITIVLFEWLNLNFKTLADKFECLNLGGKKFTAKFKLQKKLWKLWWGDKIWLGREQSFCVMRHLKHDMTIFEVCKTSMLGSHAYHPSIMPWLTPGKRAKESAQFQSNIIQHLIIYFYATFLKKKRYNDYFD